MPSLKDLRTQINSVSSTKKITSAMKMVAASKLRRSQERAEASRPYSSRMEEMLSSLASSGISGEGVINLLKGNGKEDSYLIIPVTADRGLCGGFNSNINRETYKFVKKLESEKKKVKILTIGKKSRDFFNKIFKDKIINSYIDLGTTGAGYEKALEISNYIQKQYFENNFDICKIIFNKFKSAITQEVSHQQIIPLDIKISNEEEIQNSNEKENSSIYDYEPDEKSILEDLLPKNIAIQIFKVLLESDAGEQGARMAAMDNATRNAGDLVEKLTINYNRSRQAAITKELIEIISGAESL